MLTYSRFMASAACAFALLAMPLRAQNDNGAQSAPPPPDNAAPAAPDGDGGAAQATGSQPADDGSSAQDQGVTFQTFYDSLASQGTWIQSPQYGYVWQPQVTDPDWAPYTEGNWVYSDAGWTWVSDEPWGWATYHYGRWVNLDGTGWCWVPGYTWAPAWVSWRYGDGYAGWAPLPPDSFVGVDYTDDGSSIGVGFHIGGDCDNFYGIGPGWYVFLPANCLGYRSYHGYYCHRGDNYAIINRTTNVTNINVTRAGASGGSGTFHHHVTTGGPMLAQVNAVTSTPVQRVSLVRTNQPGGGGKISGNSLSLYAPRVTAGTDAQPTRVAGTIANVGINRGTDITRPPAVNSYIQSPAASEGQVQQARIAQNHAPAGAKVMIDPSTVQPILNVPLTSMKPVVSGPSPSRFMNPTTTVMPNSQREPSVYGNTSPGRTYPQTGGPGGYQPRVYSPQGPVTSPAPSAMQTHPITTSSPGSPEPRPYVRPASPSGGYSAPAQPAPTVHPGAGSGSGGGGYSSGGGGASHVPSGGGASGAGGSGGYHGGSNSSQSH